MPTKKGIWYEGASYHITVRGIRKSEIFRDREDFKAYLKIMENNLIYYSDLNYRLVVYCLMTNHVHLIIQTDKEPLARFMGRINSMYTKYFNKKYEYVGHLFQNTYFSDIIQTDEKMLEVSKYIHLNPVKAKMVEYPELYTWSSYLMYIGKRKEQLINRDIILRYFQRNRKFKLYKEFVERVN